MSEQDQQQRKQEYRDQEVMSKISQYNAVTEYRQQVLKTNYAYKKVDKSMGKLGWLIVLTQAVFLVFFSTLFLFSYIPHTKKIVSMIMP